MRRGASWFARWRVSPGPSRWSGACVLVSDTGSGPSIPSRAPAVSSTATGSCKWAFGAGTAESRRSAWGRSAGSFGSPLASAPCCPWWPATRLRCPFQSARIWSAGFGRRLTCGERGWGARATTGLGRTRSSEACWRSGCSPTAAQGRSPPPARPRCRRRSASSATMTTASAGCGTSRSPSTPCCGWA